MLSRTRNPKEGLTLWSLHPWNHPDHSALSSSHLGDLGGRLRRKPYLLRTPARTQYAQDWICSQVIRLKYLCAEIPRLVIEHCANSLPCSFFGFTCSATRSRSTCLVCGACVYACVNKLKLVIRLYFTGASAWAVRNFSKLSSMQFLSWRKFSVVAVQN